MKKKCPYTRKEVAAYYFNECSREKETEMQEHMLQCDDCKKYLSGIRDLSDELKNGEGGTSDVKPRLSPKYLIAIITVAASIAVFYFILPVNQQKSYPIEQLKDNDYNTSDSAKIEKDTTKQLNPRKERLEEKSTKKTF